MSNATINIEFMAGTTIRDAIIEAKRIAIILRIAYVCFKFNGRDFSVGRGCDINEALMDWENNYINKNKIFCYP